MARPISAQARCSELGSRVVLCSGTAVGVGVSQRRAASRVERTGAGSGPPRNQMRQGAGRSCSERKALQGCRTVDLQHDRDKPTERTLRSLIHLLPYPPLPGASAQPRSPGPSLPFPGRGHLPAQPVRSPQSVRLQPTYESGRHEVLGTGSRGVFGGKTLHRPDTSRSGTYTFAL
ncbi:hypothetical protein BV20DRAFT_712439 [Pilatotrama ljubarskyi]|nr:hypothetical protein BV20DRAFT_712439 [Pilatotrama ljubarskyi]